VILRGASFVAVVALANGAVLSDTPLSKKPLDSGRRHIDVDECQEEVEDLRATLKTRPVIDQAKGILVGQTHCTPDEAFVLLTEASQKSNRKIRDVAHAIVQAESQRER
jgi:AmiR/NasT family two-component response regulator